MHDFMLFYVLVEIDLRFKRINDETDVSLQTQDNDTSVPHISARRYFDLDRILMERRCDCEWDVIRLN